MWILTSFEGLLNSVTVTVHKLMTRTRRVMLIFPARIADTGVMIGAI